HYGLYSVHMPDMYAAEIYTLSLHTLFRSAIEQGRGTKLGNIGEQVRAADALGKRLVVFQGMYRFREDAIGTGFQTGTRAINRGLQAFLLERIRTRDDKEIIVSLAVYSRLDAINHFLFGNDFLVRAMAATLLRHLVFQVHGAGTSLDHFLYGAGNIERPAPAGINVDQQRHFGGAGNSAHILKHIVHKSEERRVGKECRSGVWADA